MDKSWIDLGRTGSLDVYSKGLDSFLDFAFSNRPSGATEIRCPCKKCINRNYYDRDTVKYHCLTAGFEKTYKNWTSHGEEYRSRRDNSKNDNIINEGDGINENVQDSMRQMVNEVFGMPGMTVSEQPIEDVVQSDQATSNFLKLLKEARQPLWDGCEEFTSLSFIVEMMHCKANFKISDIAFTKMLKIFKRALPKSAKVPSSYYEAYKMTAALGFGYQTWDACINHCMLFRNDAEKLEKCDICGESRYKKPETESVNDENDDDIQTKKIAAKKVWYFPLKPRLQRLFWSSKTSSLMRWHKEERVDDGVLRHPADSPAWKKLMSNTHLLPMIAVMLDLG